MRMLHFMGFMIALASMIFAPMFRFAAEGISALAAHLQLMPPTPRSIFQSRRMGLA